ncbi:hypothetical protein HKI87_07g50800 [Chloropicon roscoffensis]|uniref:Uncharacterized protein n=1 Tax=Chloropicon roscoffensis TaxID=1461544 RepID=A0AAX4PBZ9_9CHLO
MCESNDEVQQTLVEDEFDGIPEDQWKALQEVKGWGEAEVGEGGGGPGGENEEDAMAPESEETRATTRRADEVHQPVHDDHAPSPAPGASPSKDLEGFEGVPPSQREALASIPGWKEEAAAPAVQVAPPPRDHPVNEEEDSEVMGEGGNGKAGEGDAQETVDPYVDVPIATQNFEDPPVAVVEEGRQAEAEAETREGHRPEGRTAEPETAEIAAAAAAAEEEEEVLDASIPMPLTLAKPFETENGFEDPPVAVVEEGRQAEAEAETREGHRPEGRTAEPETAEIAAAEEEEEEEEVEAEPRKMSSDLRDALGRLVSLHRERAGARDTDWRAKKRRAVLAYFGFDPSSQAKPLDPIVSRLLGRRTAP